MGALQNSVRSVIGITSETSTACCQDQQQYQEVRITEILTEIAVLKILLIQIEKEVI